MGGGALDLWSSHSWSYAAAPTASILFSYFTPFTDKERRKEGRVLEDLTNEYHARHQNSYLGRRNFHS